MDETRRGGDPPRDDEPREPRAEPERPGAPEPPSEVPTSNFPTFGRTPGWEDDPDDRTTSYSRPFGQHPTEPYGQRDYGWDPYGQRPSERQAYEQQTYGQQTYGQPYDHVDDQGYGYPGYAYEQPQPPVAYPGYGYAGYGPVSATETETGAVVSLILAVLSWAVCPVVLAIPALIVAASSRAKIRSFPGRYSGLGLITAARVVAWANIGVFVGMIFLFGVLAAAGVD